MSKHLYEEIDELHRVLERLNDSTAALEAKNKALQHDLNGAKGNVKNLLPTVDYWKAQTKRLEAENERLRKALDRIERATRILPPEYDEPGSPFAEARAALEAKP